jgi:glycosyltransferase involved in cell wall biosynthesis
VVIPAYQAASVIAGAVESALSQTLAPREVVVCDDGSTDDLDGALAPYRQRIVVVRKPNGGGASALNAAVRAASSEFVSWLDADDAYEPERLEALGELAAARPDLDILMTDSWLESDGEVVGRFGEFTPFEALEQRLAILDRCFVAWPAVRRARVLEVGGFDERLRIAYDWDFWIRCLFSGAAAGLVDVPLHRYRISGSSLSGRRAAAMRERVDVLEKALRLDGLTRDERAALERSLRSKRSRALLTEAESALAENAGDARSRAWALALARGAALSPRLRMAAVVAALAPGWAGRRLAARAREGAARSRLERSVPGR